ncbi:hypothetical protein [Robbsia sp. KACC 23696]|uniref:hypothetical protein n=1 Tax=Robbsia sp. KACC 23696 TaxID=3149231 RepID=UPI00325A5A81
MPNREGGRYSPPIRGRLAARHTLLAETYMGITMIALGYSGQTGGDGSGVLHQVLERMGIDDIWGYCFIVIGLAMVWFSLSEFFIGRHWDDKTISWFATWRKGCAASAGILWLIVGYLLSTTSLSAFKGLTLTVPVHLALAAYFVWENSRVRFFIGKESLARAR